MHRSDLLAILYDACQAQGVGLHPDQDVRAVTDAVDAATAECADGSRLPGRGRDRGRRPALRRPPAVYDDQPVCSGFAAYRGTAGVYEVTARSRLDEVVAWIGADLHFVQYPLRAGQIYNQVAVFRSPKYAADPHLADGQWGGPGELDEAFAACCPQVREATGFLWRDRWWPMYDREPLAGGPAAGSRCWATRRTRCCSTWPRAPARPSRTPTRWPAPWPPAPARTWSARRWPSTSKPAPGTPPGCNAPPGPGVTSGTSTASARCCGTSCSAAARPTTTATPTGSTDLSAGENGWKPRRIKRYTRAMVIVVHLLLAWPR